MPGQLICGQSAGLKNQRLLVRLRPQAPYALLAQLESEHAASTRRVGSSSLSQGTKIYTPLAQRNRALVYGTRCRGFESLKACQYAGLVFNGQHTSLPSWGYGFESRVLLQLPARMARAQSTDRRCEAPWVRYINEYGPLGRGTLFIVPNTYCSFDFY